MMQDVVVMPIIFVASAVALCIGLIKLVEYERKNWD
jgi:hypothetical protein